MLSRVTLRRSASAVATLRRCLRTSASASGAAAVAASSWSQTLSFASPESDFCQYIMHQQQDSTTKNKNTRNLATMALHENNHQQEEWASADVGYSFASPEADFTAWYVTHPSDAEKVGSVFDAEWTGSMSFASPEADFSAYYVAHPEERVQETVKVEQRAAADEPLWSETLSFASPESDFVSKADRTVPKFEIPRTYAEALQEHARAVVITTASPPHNIVHVNEAWEKLCGYTKSEALDRTLPYLIQGPETNMDLANAMVRKMKKTKAAADAYLVNYRKDGKSYINHITVGPLSLPTSDDGEQMEFLVGILEPVERDQVPLRMVHA